MEEKKILPEDDFAPKKEPKKVNKGHSYSNPNDLIANMVNEILGDRVNLRIYGIGREQTLEIKLPDDLSSHTIDQKQKYPKDHELAGELMGDTRSCVIHTTDQIRKWLILVKDNIIKEFSNRGELPKF